MAGWAADPPDNNFNTVTPPTVTDFTRSSASATTGS